MPIRIIVSILAAAVVFSLFQDHKGGVQAESRVMRTVNTTPRLGIQKVKYRVITTGSVTSTTSSYAPKDLFRIRVQGLVLQDGDCVSFSLAGADGTVDIGSPTFAGANPCLTLANRKAKGAIGDSPYLYPKAKLRFNPRRSRLNFSSGKGLAQAAPVLSALGKTTNNPITLTVHVRRPGDGDFDFVFNGLFNIKHNIKRRTQLHTYRGVSK